MINMFTTEAKSLTAIQQNSCALEHASPELKNDREIVLEAVKQNGWALYFASEELKNDREIVLEAVKQNSLSLQYASDELKNDREIVLEAVTQNAWMIRHASDQLKNDREIVLAAITKNGRALEYASDELKNDRKIVLAAITKNSWALEHASAKLKNDTLFFWQAWRCSSSKLALIEFLFKEVFKLSLGMASTVFGTLLLSGVIALPLPSIALLVVGACLASAGTVYTGHKLYQHGLGFFNTAEVNITEDSKAQQMSA